MRGLLIDSLSLTDADTETNVTSATKLIETPRARRRRVYYYLLLPFPQLLRHPPGVLAFALRPFCIVNYISHLHTCMLLNHPSNHHVPDFTRTRSRMSTLTAQTIQKSCCLELNIASPHPRVRALSPLYFDRAFSEQKKGMREMERGLLDVYGRM